MSSPDLSSSDATYTVPSGIDSEDWRSFFVGYSNIVLVANSDEVDINELVSRFPETTLFIFFNKVYKVLSKPFTRSAILVSRSGTLGANLVKSGKVSRVLQYFDKDSFLGIINMAIGDREKFSPASEFGGVTVRHLDLTAVFAPFYPTTSFPTSGFALCFWLANLQLPATITLAGFSSKRSERYQVLDVHDWTFEQVVLRLMYRRGKIDILGRERTNPYADLSEHFPEYSPGEIALTANEVLSERLVNLSSIVDRLMQVTRFLRFIDRTYKKLKPRTRKQRRWDAMEGK
nr:3-deoxy-manno-octulosonate cytidylyltransferase [Rhizobium grahamii]